MPNLDPPVSTVDAALGYADRIRSQVPAESGFAPLMTLYLTGSMSPEEIERAAATPGIAGVKLYPRGATTNSAHGIDGLNDLASVLEAMEKFDLPLLIHGEATDVGTDVFDRERVFLEETLAPLSSRHPGLRLVFEHITTRDAAQWVAEARPGVGATITPQHLLLNRNALFEGGVRPHHYCLPVLKREHDRIALVEAATSGSPRFFLGTDSAPHVRQAKESACGCAGVFSAPVAIEAYAQAFAEAGALGRLEGFASHFGADFYGLPRNKERVVLERVDWRVPLYDGEGDTALQIFRGGEPLLYRWRD
jgi:dihydroorotase